MPALVNYGGEEDFRSSGALYNLMDSSLILSLGSHVDVYCPPRKRSRITAPFVLRSDKSHKTEEEGKRPSIEILPDECLFEILRRVGGEERRDCARVSKRWLMLLSSIRRAEFCSSKPIPSVMQVDESSKPKGPSPVVNDVVMSAAEEELESETDGFLTRCLEGKRATDIRLAAIAVGTSTRGGLGKLVIRGSNSTRGVSDWGLTAIARGCPSLKSLAIGNVASVTDEGLSQIANGCHKLEKLDLCECPAITDRGLVAIAQNCPRLMSLTIESCLKIGNEGLQAIGQCCPNLRSVSIKNCSHVGDQGIAGLVSAASSVLMKINLQAVNISDLSLAVIGYYGKAISDIALSGLQNVSERGFWVMGSALGLQKLKSLAIVACRGVTDVSLEALGKGCPNLKQLHLRRCSFVSDNGLRGFTAAAMSLECLHLEECNRITQLGVLGAFSNCGQKLKALALVKCLGIKDTVPVLPTISPSLSMRSLTISNCPAFGATGLAVIGRLCPQLKHLDLSGLSCATDAGLIALLESCEPGLVKVNLAGCVNVTDAAVMTLVRVHGGTLELLSLEGCRKVTDKSMSAIADDCFLLLDLDASKCLVTDAGVSSLACAKQLDLQMLSLSGCSHLSNKCMSDLRELGRFLKGLNLQHCNLISNGTVRLLGEQLWRCDILF